MMTFSLGSAAESGLDGVDFPVPDRDVMLCLRIAGRVDIRNELAEGRSAPLLQACALGDEIPVRLGVAWLGEARPGAACAARVSAAVLPTARQPVQVIMPGFSPSWATTGTCLPHSAFWISKLASQRKLPPPIRVS
jgi:hypothetical protein